jgi:serine/threonine-protein kinase
MSTEGSGGSGTGGQNAPVSVSQLHPAADGEDTGAASGIEEEELTPIISIDAIPGRPSEEKPPIRVLGNYEVLQSIGSGGMAEVFLARHAGPMGFEKILVLKCIHPHLSKQKNFVDMFLDEARLAARINDPRVVQIHELGEANGTYFMAMEYLAGESLSTVLKTAIRGGAVLPAPLAARVVADAAAGLHAAHELRDAKGRLLEVVHRDVSHGNIVVLYSGAVKILDFGVAKARDSLQKSTSAGERKGKYGYMSPEQVRGEAIDRRSDVFSLGVVLWEALTKQRLFAADSELETVRRVIDGVVPMPSAIVKDVPPELDAIVLRALAKERDKRYQTAQELALALEAWLRATGAAATMNDVAAFMRSAFAERIEMRAKLMRVGALGDGPDEPPLADIASDSKQSELHTEIAALRASRRRVRILLAGLGASVLLFAAYNVGRSRSDDVPRASAHHVERPTTPHAGSAVSAPMPPPPDLSVEPPQVLAEATFDRAQRALDEGRIAAPPGDNALELVLEGEKQAPGSARAKTIRGHAIARLVADAEQLWSAGKLESARTVYADVLLFDPENALAKQRSKAPKNATNAAVTSTSPDEVPWLVTQIDLAIIERRLVAPPGRNALEYLQQLRKVDPSNQVVRRLGGQVASALQAEAKAKPAESKDLLAAAKVASGAAAGMQPAHTEPEKVGDPVVAAQWVQAGNQKLAAGNLGDARNAFSRAVSADPGSHAALAGLAEVAYNESDYTRAVLAAKRALRYAPSSTAYRMLLAKSYYKLLRYDDAIKQWQKVLEIEPKNAAAQKNIEMAERRKGEQ